MVRCSNFLFGLLNLASFLLSIPILGGGIWLATKGDSDCGKSLQWPVIAIGAALMLVSLAGLVGVCCKVSCLLWVYLCAMFLLILLLLISTVFSLVETKNGADDSSWLQKTVTKGNNWRNTKTCIRDGDDCKSLAEDSAHETAKQFLQRKLSAIESGCCKPPTSCGFTFVNATYWRTTATSAKASDSDCATWSNDPSQLCYDCRACKAGVVESVRSDWRKDAIIDVAVLVALVVVYGIGCCAFWNIRREKGLDVPPGLHCCGFNC